MLQCKVPTTMRGMGSGSEIGSKRGGETGHKTGGKTRSETEGETGQNEIILGFRVPSLAPYLTPCLTGVRWWGP